MSKANYERGRLIAETVLQEASSTMEVTGLNISEDGGVYDVVIGEYDTGETIGGHSLKINDIETGYQTNFITTSDDTEVRHESNNAGLCYTNGWTKGQIVFYTVGTLVKFNQDWISFLAKGNGTNANGKYVTVDTCGVCLNQNIRTINSLRVISLDYGNKIGPGSFIKVYKR